MRHWSAAGSVPAGHPPGSVVEVVLDVLVEVVLEVLVELDVVEGKVLLDVVEVCTMLVEVVEG